MEVIARKALAVLAVATVWVTADASVVALEKIVSSDVRLLQDTSLCRCQAEWENYYSGGSSGGYYVIDGITVMPCRVDTSKSSTTSNNSYGGFRGIFDRRKLKEENETRTLLASRSVIPHSLFRRHSGKKSSKETESYYGKVRERYGLASDLIVKYTHEDSPKSSLSFVRAKVKERAKERAKVKERVKEKEKEEAT